MSDSAIFTIQLWVADLATSDLGNKTSTLHKFCAESSPCSALLVPTTQSSNERTRLASGRHVWWKGTANSFLAVKQGKVPTSFLYKMSHWPMRGCKGWLELPRRKTSYLFNLEFSPNTHYWVGWTPRGSKRGASLILWNGSQLDLFQEEYCFWQ